MKSLYEKIFKAFDLDVLNNYTLVFEDYLQTPNLGPKDKHESDKQVLERISGNIENDISLLSELGDNKILLMYDSNPNWHFEDYFLKLSERVDNVYLASSNLLNLWRDHPRIVYLPTFYFTQLQKTDYQTLDKEYRFSFLSNKPRFHRIYFHHIVKDVITDDDCFSVNNQAFGGGYWKEMYINDMNEVIGTYDNSIEQGLPFITQNALICNQESNTVGNLTNDHSNKHIAYNSYFNITGETDNTSGRVFLTEKTWKAVRSGVIPLFLESGSIFGALEKVGFNFENEINIKDVNFIDKVVHIKKCMQTYDMHKSYKLYNNELPNIKKNKERFYDIELQNIFINHVRRKLNL